MYTHTYTRVFPSGRNVWRKTGSGTRALGHLGSHEIVREAGNRDPWGWGDLGMNAMSDSVPLPAGSVSWTCQLFPRERGATWRNPDWPGSSPHADAMLSSSVLKSPSCASPSQFGMDPDLPMASLPCCCTRSPSRPVSPDPAFPKDRRRLCFSSSPDVLIQNLDSLM